MRRPPITAILTAGACALGLAAPVAAQTPAPHNAAPSSANAAGLRYLSWPGRAYRPVPAAPGEVAEAAPTPVPAPAATTPGRPPIIPHGGQPAYAPAPPPSPPRQGLTPASAWIGSQAPAYAPQPAPMAAPPAVQPYSAPTTAPAPVGAPWSRARAVVSAAPAVAAPSTPSGYFAETAEAAPPVLASSAPHPVRVPAARPAPAPQPAPARAAAPTPVMPAVAPVPAAPAPTPAAAPVLADAPVPAPVAAPVADPVADPMAPRRDAPIFRLQRPAAEPQAQAQIQAQAAPQPAPVAETPAAQGGARYYSVHRQAGRQPDATPLPAPVYLDALPVDLTAMPASTDLAEPPAAPNLIRNANGRLQALPANEDPVLP